MKEIQTYKDAINELEILASAMEGNEVSIDELTDKVARANILISFCEAKLRETETAVRLNSSENIQNETKE